MGTGNGPHRHSREEDARMKESDDWFIAADLIIGGVVAETMDFPKGDNFDYWMSQVKADFQSVVDRNVLWEVYAMEHDHAPELDCDCVQYLQSHHPYWTSANE